MKYENAKDILPLRLLEEVQRYAGGEKYSTSPRQKSRRDGEKPPDTGRGSIKETRILHLTCPKCILPLKTL